MSLIGRTLRTLGLKRGDQTGGPGSQEKRDRISRVTGLPVENLELYERALRHASVVRHRRNRLLDSNERLEFLGDAVLGLAAADYLFERFPDKNEGFLTRVRAKLVNQQVLSGYADTIKLQPLLEMSDDMDRAGGRLNPSLLANAFEALLGAIYIEHGYLAARRFVLATIARSVNLEELAERRENYKSLLLEYVQARGWPQPHYRVLAEDGPGHQRTFFVEVVIGSEPYGSGRGKNKKAAEQHAARASLRYLEKSASKKLKDKQVALTG